MHAEVFFSFRRGRDGERVPLLSCNERTVEEQVLSWLVVPPFGSSHLKLYHFRGMLYRLLFPKQKKFNFKKILKRFDSRAIEFVPKKIRSKFERVTLRRTVSLLPLIILIVLSRKYNPRGPQTQIQKVGVSRILPKLKTRRLQKEGERRRKGANPCAIRTP